jgi:hypothetical protein
MSLVVQMALRPYELLGRLRAGVRVRTYVPCLAAALAKAVITSLFFLLTPD